MEKLVKLCACTWIGCENNFFSYISNIENKVFGVSYPYNYKIVI